MSVKVSVTPDAAEQLSAIDVLVEGLDRESRYDVVVRDPQGHATTHRSVEPTDEGTYPFQVTVDARGVFTIEVFSLSDPDAQATFRGV